MNNTLTHKDNQSSVLGYGFQATSDQIRAVADHLVEYDIQIAQSDTPGSLRRATEAEALAEIRRAFPELATQRKGDAAYQILREAQAYEPRIRPL